MKDAFTLSLFDDPAPPVPQSTTPLRRDLAYSALLVSSVAGPDAVDAMTQFVQVMESVGVPVPRFQNDELIDWTEVARRVNSLNGRVASDRPAPRYTDIMNAIAALERGIW